MLGVPLDLSLISVYKGLWVTQVLAEECLELVSCDQDKGLCIMSPLLLLPTKADPVSEEEHGKENLSRPCSSSISKVVLTLLIKVVIVYMGLFAVYVRRAGLQLLLGHLRDDGSWDRSGSGSGNGSWNSSLQNGLKNLLQVILGIFGDTNSSKKGVSKGFCPWGSSRLVGQFVTWFGRWKEVKRSNGGSNRGTFSPGTFAASNWGHLGADFLKHSFKWAG